MYTLCDTCRLCLDGNLLIENKRLCLTSTILINYIDESCNCDLGNSMPGWGQFKKL